MRRLALAAALTAGIVGVVLFGSVSNGNHASTQRGALAPALAAPGADLSGNVAVTAAKSPAQSVGVSRAYRTPPVRTSGRDEVLTLARNSLEASFVSKDVKAAWVADLQRHR